jgi:hypothetical protein
MLAREAGKNEKEKRKKEHWPQPQVCPFFEDQGKLLDKCWN